MASGFPLDWAGVCFSYSVYMPLARSDRVYIFPRKVPDEHRKQRAHGVGERQFGRLDQTAAATGALKGAGEISQEAVEQVRQAATGMIAGVKVNVKEPFK
jgi:hypothetical protein